MTTINVVGITIVTLNLQHKSNRSNFAYTFSFDVLLMSIPNKLAFTNDGAIAGIRLFTKQ